MTIADALRLIMTADKAEVAAAAAAIEKPTTRKKATRKTAKKAAAKPAESKPVEKPARKAKSASTLQPGTSEDRMVFEGHGSKIIGFETCSKRGRVSKGIRFADAWGRSFICTLEEYAVLSNVIRSADDAAIRKWFNG